MDSTANTPLYATVGIQLKHKLSGTRVLHFWNKEFVNITKCNSICRRDHTKLREAIISFVIPLRPHATILFSHDGFSWSLIFEYFSKNLSTKFKFLSQLTGITDTPQEDLPNFMITPRWFLARTRNFSDKRCVGNQNTHTLCSVTFFFSAANRAVWDNVNKYGRTKQVTDTHSEYVILIVFFFHCNNGYANAPYTCSVYICYKRSKPRHKLCKSWRTRAKMNVNLHVK